MKLRLGPAVLAAGVAIPALAFAGGGPLGIDHRLPLDDHGLWKRSVQVDLEIGSIVGDVGFALWEGGESRLGRTAWQSVDSMVLAGGAANLLKPVFGRKRPNQTGDPNQWFKGGSSFPSGEVASITGIVTPYVLEYRKDEPAVYALELLPLYDGIARMKVHGHWQTDVLGGFALGSFSGYWAHERKEPLILGWLPGGFSVGVRERF